MKEKLEMKFTSEIFLHVLSKRKTRSCELIPSTVKCSRPCPGCLRNIGG
jgi:hypothetical protein